MILLLVVASNLFGAVFSRLGSPEFMAEWLLGLSLPPMVMLGLILGLIFVLGWPLEWVPIVLIVVPVVLPIVQAAGIDMIWFCTPGGGDAADGVAVTAGGLVGLLPQGRGAAVGVEADLRRHGAVHGAAGRGRDHLDDLSQAGDLAARCELIFLQHGKACGVSAPQAFLHADAGSVKFCLINVFVLHTFD